MMNEFEIAIRRLILARLNKMAYEELGDRVPEMFHFGQWSGMLNRIDPDSPHCVSSDYEAQLWSEKAILYLKGYSHGLNSAKHTTPASVESTLHAKRGPAR